MIDFDNFSRQRYSKYDEDIYLMRKKINNLVSHMNDGTSVGVTLTELNATYSANNIYARMEYGMIKYSNNFHQERNTMIADSGDEYEVGAIYEYESSSGYYIDLGYDIGSLVGCGDDSNLYLWMRTSSYNKDDNGDSKDIQLFGVTYKPINNISFKLETGTVNDDNIMRLGLGYMF